MVTGLCRGICGTRLVCQQYFDSGKTRGAGEGCGRIAALRGIEMMRAVVGYASDDNGLAVVIEDRVFIKQHIQTEPAYFRDPGVCTRVVLVVASDEVGAMARGEPRERRGVRSKPLNASIHQVAGYGDQVRLQVVDGIDDAADVAVLDRRADMDVADLHDAEAMQARRQSLDRYIDVADPRPPAGIDESCNRQEGGNRRNGRRTPGLQSQQRRDVDE